MNLLEEMDNKEGEVVTQVVDLLTKGIINDVFKRLKMNMGMEDLEHLN